MLNLNRSGQKNASATDSISLLTQSGGFKDIWIRFLMDLERFRLKNERLLIIFFVVEISTFKNITFLRRLRMDFLVGSFSGVYQNFFIKFHKGFVNELCLIK
jgi:hypothetical protein